MSSLLDVLVKTFDDDITPFSGPQRKDREGKQKWEGKQN